MYVVWRRPDGFIHASCRNGQPTRSVFAPYTILASSQLDQELAQLRVKGYEVLGTFEDWRDAKICIWTHRLEQGWQPDFEDPEGRYPNYRPGPVGIVCEGFLLCTQQATNLVNHPVLRKVPMCVRCAVTLEHR